MIFAFFLVAIVGSVVSGIMAIRVHGMRGANASSRWFARFGVLSTIGLLLNTVPGLIFPALGWLRIGCSILSMLLVAMSIPLIRHAIRAAKVSNTPTAQR